MVIFNTKKIKKIKANYAEEIQHSDFIFALRFKRDFRIFVNILLKLLIAFFVTLLFVATIVGIVDGIQTYTQMSKVSATPLGVTDLIVQIVVAIFMAIYIFFVPAIAWILTLFQTLLYILSVYPIILYLWDGSVETFVIFSSVIFLILGFIFLIVKFFKIFWTFEENGKEKKRFIQNIFQAILLIVFIPYLIIFLNVLVIFITQSIFNISNLDDTSLVVILFNNSFYDYPHDYDSIIFNPLSPDLQNFSFLIFILSSGTLAILLYFVIIDLSVRIFEIIILLVVSPIVISISITDDAVRFRLWFRIMMQKIFNVVFIFGSYTLYIALIPFISKFAYTYLSSYSVLIQEGFIILMVIAGAFMLENTKTLLIFIFGAGTAAGFATTIQNISGRTKFYNNKLKSGLRMAASPYTYTGKAIYNRTLRTNVESKRLIAKENENKRLKKQLERRKR